MATPHRDGVDASLVAEELRAKLKGISVGELDRPHPNTPKPVQAVR